MAITQRFATEKYVEEVVANLVNSAPETLDTIGELAIALEENKDVTEALDAAITKKANLSDLESAQESINTNANSIKSIQEQVAAILELIYPKGSIYISTIETNPSVLFGFGVWEQIKDTFLLSAGDSYAAGSTGGEAEHKLTTSEMPKHTHKPSSSSVPNATEYADYHFGIIRDMASVSTARRRVAAGTDYFALTAQPSVSDYASDSDISHSAETASTGGGTAHNNMPPYLAVYVWKRVK